MTAKKTAAPAKKAAAAPAPRAPAPRPGVDPRETGIESQASPEQRRALADTADLGAAAAPPTPTNETARTALEPGIAGNEGGLQPGEEVIPRRRVVADEPAKVRVFAPRPFRLTDDKGLEHRYEAGEQDMPEEHASHWYAKANGVEFK